MKISGQQRKAISPIVATVLIIAATLIAAAAILGYVFGIFGSASNTANVAVTSVSLSASKAGSIVLVNTGTASLTLAANPSFTISYGGTTCSVTTTNSAQTLAGGGGTGTIAVAAPTSGQYCGTTGPVATPGEAFTGSVPLPNGEAASFSGAFAT
jgi:flagellin-like protein